MKQFMLRVHINPLQATRTIAFSSTALGAKWICDSQFGRAMY